MDNVVTIYAGESTDSLSCESILRQMPNGDWVTFIQSGGSAEPRPENDVFLARSRDQGQTWSDLIQLFELPDKATYQTEAFVLGQKVLLFVSTHNGGFLDWESWVTVSEDSGYTWSPFQALWHLPRRTFIRTAMVARDGRILLPYQHYELRVEEEERLRAAGKPIMRSTDAVAENGVLISSDGGAEWTQHGGIHVPTPGWSWAENNIVELIDGTIAMLIRADRTGVLFRADSVDGGFTWSEPYPTSIPNPGNKVRLFRLTDDRIVLLNTATTPENLDRLILDARHPMSMWISEDDMVSWHYKREVLNVPGHHSYPDGFVDETEAFVHFACDHKRKNSLYVRAPIPLRQSSNTAEAAPRATGT